MRIAVLITCFNRRVETEHCISNLMKALKNTNLEIDIFITDGGSTDGTVNSIRQNFPRINLIVKENAYWNQGMLSSWTEAEKFEFDGFLLLNDDLHMEDLALDALYKSIHATNNSVIIVGRTISGNNGNTTYGALARETGISKLSFINSDHSRMPPVTMNGNFTYIPKLVHAAIGKLSAKFTHSMGDIDYGLRATKLGFRILELENPVATQEYNFDWAQSTEYLTFGNYKRILFHPKGVPLREWLYFCKSHGGIIWPINFIARYVRRSRKT